MTKNTFHLVSLGCAKNTVDSDSMMQLLVRDGYHAVDKASRADVLIVNTCGFIGPAKQESLDTLRDLAAGKKKNQILIAAGCLTQRYGVEVAQQVPGIDGILGTRRWMDIVQVVSQLRKTKHPEPLYHLPEAETELVSGFCTEYSSMKYALFFMAEYANMIVLSAVIATLFLGGWDGPVWGVINLLIKVVGFMMFFMWIRATWPRVRYDQLMYLGWKIFIPLALLNIVVTGFFILL